MTGSWKKLPALALAGLWFIGTAQAQQSAEPPAYYVPAALPQNQPTAIYTPAPTGPTIFAMNYKLPPAAVSPEVLTTPPLAAHSPAKLGKPVFVAEDQGIAPASCASCAAKKSQQESAPLLKKKSQSSTECGCAGSKEGSQLPHPTKNLLIKPVHHYIIKPVHHFLLMDCWGNHDEYGCGSFQAEMHFAFGSCRTYFGETCGPPPPVPVPPGYFLTPPGPRSGPPVPVPPELPPQLTPGTRN